MNLRMARLGAESESAGQVLVEFGAGQRRIQQMDDGRFSGRHLQRLANQRRLPRSGFAHDDGDAGSTRQAVLEVRQCFAVLCGEAQESRIWRQIEGPLVQAVKAFVHVYLRNVHATVAQIARTVVAATPIATRRRRPPPAVSRTLGIVANTIKLSAARTSRSVRSVLSKNSLTAAAPKPMASAATIESKYSLGRSGLHGFSGSRAGSRILNCSPICRFSRFADICDSSFFFNSVR